MQRLGEAAGRFQWNRAGWFGGQIGATLWLVLLGSLLLGQGRMGGLVVMALGLLPNVVGAVLWQFRRSFNPYPAVQLLLGVSGLSALVAMLFLRAPDLSSVVAPMDLRALLVYPAVMSMLYVQERAARHQAS